MQKHVLDKKPNIGLKFMREDCFYETTSLKSIRGL